MSSLRSSDSSIKKSREDAGAAANLPGGRAMTAET
jgi:hypothetical protein